ncbi:gamma-glutamyl-gamma-aminobutyrate hydrolase family protein [Nocardioides marmoribigeumensis]|uniref:Glutamine amidotransferase n=1 Tax=Nocardioides marmoribigeumensis TaxID=433649 RepID=A0ABU2BXP1_9ACTN|nr:gamma-glutamyl-gamma-aminobutyrate hydrolase family protein [Nocardioides marmoribigeumensis]MDR7363171.1 putative glutamine amidotransferase [Nocardioides marmoribigeumensis]
MRPLVAVVGRRADSVPILRFSATLAAEAICEAVYAGGGEPVVVHGPAADPTEGLQERLARFDGVLIPGGADLGPGRYGQQPHPGTVAVVDFQDELDLAAARAAVAADLPTLAICRGMQVLNVALGGTLLQHVEETTVRHRDAQHDVAVVRGSRLHAIVGGDRVPVSSYHHQAIDVLAPDLVVTATADDGLVEAVEHRTADVLAVQWHPEDLHAISVSDAALFADLVERAQKRSQNR